MIELGGKFYKIEIKNVCVEFTDTGIYSIYRNVSKVPYSYRVHSGLPEFNGALEALLRTFNVPGRTTFMSLFVRL